VVHCESRLTEEGHLEVVKLLLECKSQLSERNSQNMSAAMSAAAGERHEVIAFLVQRAGGEAQLWNDELALHPELVLGYLERGALTDVQPDAMHD